VGDTELMTFGHMLPIPCDRKTENIIWNNREARGTSQNSIKLGKVNIVTDERNHKHKHLLKCGSKTNKTVL
jgi:hypothetical protein